MDFTTGPDLARNLRTARRARDLTQAELAGVLGVQTLTLRRWESGRTFPRGAAMRAKVREWVRSNSGDRTGRGGADHVAESPPEYRTGRTALSDDLTARILAHVDWSAVEQAIVGALRDAISSVRAEPPPERGDPEEENSGR